ncbi:hypothetical protein PRIPAC_90819, partial [Pristionchus pacificus]
QVTASRLVFGEVTEADGGVYKCIARTKAGPLEARSVLNVGDQHREQNLPITSSMGEKVLISCPELAENSTRVEWIRGDGDPLPEGAIVSHGLLLIPSVAHSDEGSYHCVIHRPEPLPKVEGDVYLAVNDFVPTFDGQSALKLPPLKNEAYKDFNMQMTFHPSQGDGILLYTERGDEESEHPSSFHSLTLNDGKVVYQYQVGDEPVSIESASTVDTNRWNRVEMRNSADGALLILNDDEPQTAVHESFNPTEGQPKAVYLGGFPHITHRPHVNTQTFFTGVISSLELGGEPVALGSGERILSSIKPFNGCSDSLCLNGGLCLTSNTPHAFVCSCPISHRGDQCQYRSSSCNENLDCGTGVCSDDITCVCPAGRKGERCQETSLLTNGFKFISNRSFVALPTPKNPKDFKISLQLGPEHKSDSMVVYVGENYSPHSNFLSLSIKDGEIVQSYTDNDGTPQTETIHTLVNNGENIDLTVKFEEGRQRIMKGEETLAEISSPLRVGTEILIGGLPPGVPANTNAPITTSFNGCIYEIKYDDEIINVHDPTQFYSGDIEGCEPEFIPTTESTNGSEGDEGDEISIEDAEPIEERKELTEETEKKDEDEEDEDDEVIETTEHPILDVEPILHKSEVKEEKDDDAKILPTEQEMTDNVYETHSDTSVPALATTTTEEPTTEVPLTEPEPTECVGCHCDESICGEHGDCHQVNSTHIECSCHLYYDGELCDLFKPIDRVARFDGTAYIEISSDEFPHLTSEKEETISFKFKSSSPDGLILWQGQDADTSIEGEDYFSIYLEEGYLIYAYELGGGVAKGRSRRRMDDGEEHTVGISRKGRDATLAIDGDEMVIMQSSGILAMLNVDGNIYIGGIPKIEERTGGLHSINFSGCLSDLTLDGVLIDLMAAALDGRRVKPCEEWIHPRKYIHFNTKKRVRKVRSRLSARWPFF